MDKGQMLGKVVGIAGLAILGAATNWALNSKEQRAREEMEAYVDRKINEAMNNNEE